MQNLAQIFFVMWRETVEAMLVVGILHAWLSHNPQGKPGIKYLWMGVLAGLGGAFLLGLGIETLSAVLSDEGQDYFQSFLQLAAATLIVQMVFWMRRHARHLQRDMEQSLGQRTQQQNWWGVASLAAIAVAREGSETVVFLSSLVTGHNSLASPGFWVALGLGVLLAGATFYLLQLGGKRMSWRVFFKATEILLLLLACALLVSGVERLIGIQTLPALVNQVWDSSALLDDGSIPGGIVSAFTGYRARPSLMVLMVFCLYWVGVQWNSRRSL
jgi:high-affinity iron transporter